jgi:hypothetical protein
VAALLTVNSLGLYCERGGFFIDPWRPVPRALITHAHGDHALMGDWTPSAMFFQQLIAEEAVDDDRSRPYPFCLAYQLDHDVAHLCYIGVRGFGYE